MPTLSTGAEYIRAHPYVCLLPGAQPFCIGAMLTGGVNDAVEARSHRPPIAPPIPQVPGQDEHLPDRETPFTAIWCSTRNDLAESRDVHGRTAGHDYRGNALSFDMLDTGGTYHLPASGVGSHACDTETFAANNPNYVPPIAPQELERLEREQGVASNSLMTGGNSEWTRNATATEGYVGGDYLVDPNGREMITSDILHNPQIFGIGEGYDWEAIHRAHTQTQSNSISFLGDHQNYDGVVTKALADVVGLEYGMANPNERVLFHSHRTEWTTEQIMHLRIQMFNARVHAAEAAGLLPDSGTAPPLGESSYTQAEYDQQATMIDMQNLHDGIGGDYGASPDEWLGPNATPDGIRAHAVRMQSGVMRGPTDTTYGDDGSKPFSMQDQENIFHAATLNTLDTPFYALDSARQADMGNHQYASTAATSFLASATLDVAMVPLTYLTMGVGTVMIRGGMGVGARVARGLTHVAPGLAARLLPTGARASTRVVEGGSVTAIEVVEEAEHTAASAANPTRATGPSSKMPITGNGSTKKGEGMALDIEPIAVTSEARAAEELIIADARRVAEAEARAAKVIERTPAARVRGVVKKATVTATVSVGSDLALHGNLWQLLSGEHAHGCDVENGARLYGGDFDPISCLKTTGGDDPAPPGPTGDNAPAGSGPGPAPKGSKPGPSPTDQYHADLARRSDPHHRHYATRELFGAPPPVHAHQMDQSNYYLLGVLAMSGLLVASHA